MGLHACRAEQVRQALDETDLKGGAKILRDREAVRSSAFRRSLRSQQNRVG